MKTQTAKQEQPAPKSVSILAKMRHHETKYVHAYLSVRGNGRFHNMPVATVALIKDDTFGFFCGFSFCSKKDNFSRRVGRKIAFNRANSLYEVYNMDGDAVPFNAAKLSLGEAEALLEGLFAPENRMSRKRLLSLLRHARQDSREHYEHAFQTDDFDDDDEDFRMADLPDRSSQWTEDDDEDEKMALLPAKAKMPTIRIGDREPRIRKW